MAKRGSKRGSRRSGAEIPTYPSSDLTHAGQRRAVWEGRALKTRGGLVRDDLMVSKSTKKIVSKRASRASAKSFKRNGLRPDRNIAYRSVNYKGVKTETIGHDDENLDWNSMLGDA